MDLISNATDAFSLTCITTGSPPASVTWLKDGEGLDEEADLTFVQKLSDGPAATFINSLYIDGYDTEGFLGTYKCLVTDHLMNTAEQSLTVTGQTDFASVS